MANTLLILQYITALLLTVFLGRALMIFLHEMGHGIMAAAFTKGKINLYLGSQEKVTKTTTLTAGRFTFHMKRNVFAWNSGLSSSNTPVSLTHYILVLLGGSLFPVIFGIALFLIMREIGTEDMYKAATYFLIFCIIFVPINLIPYTKPLNLFTGKNSYNDGHLIRTAIRYRHVHREYASAMNNYRQEKYVEAVGYFKLLIANGMKDEHIQRLAIACFSKAKEFDALKPLLEEFNAHFKPSYIELINFGYFYSETGEHEKALDYFRKSLSMNDNFYSNYNIGYTMAVLNQYDEAVIHLDKAISHNPKNSYPFSSRGLVKIKLGLIEEGLEDLRHSLIIDPENAYYYKNMGTYHFDRKEYKKALEYFETAMNKDASVYKINEDIDAVRKMLTVDA